MNVILNMELVPHYAIFTFLSKTFFSSSGEYISSLNCSYLSGSNLHLCIISGHCPIWNVSLFQDCTQTRNILLSLKYPDLMLLNILLFTIFHPFKKTHSTDSSRNGVHVCDFLVPNYSVSNTRWQQTTFTHSTHQQCITYWSHYNITRKSDLFSLYW